MNAKFTKKSYFYLFLLCVVFIFFFMISRWAPVAGDDWGYAVGGRYTSNVIMKAFEFYLGWSGRFFSELWGFLVAPHKHAWNFINALIFTSIFYMLIKHSNTKNILLMSLLCFSLMLAVPNGLRMQTYTWIMGTTYVIPLCFFLIYLLFIRKYFFQTYKKWELVLAYILNFMIPLFMENAAAMLAGGNILLCIYSIWKEKKIRKELLVLLVISIVGVLLVRFSPGAILRMSRDHATFNALSLWQKIQVNKISFIRFTFTNNIWVMRALAIIIILLACVKKECSKWCKTILICSSLLVLCQTYSWQLFDLTKINFFYVLNDLNVPHSFTLNAFIYGFFTVLLFYSAYRFTESEEKKWFLIFILFIAGGANMVMLISPIFDVRSSIYTMYMFILFILCCVEELKISKEYYLILTCLLLATSCCLLMQYGKLYYLIHLVDLKRQEQIEYYRIRPDAKEAFILGFPSQTVHSAEIEQWDEYHMYYFKEYYYLNQDMNLNFYYLDRYTKEEIEAQ